MRQIKDLAGRGRAACRRAAQQLRAWVRRRLDRLANEPGYAEALIRVFLVAIDLLSDSRRIKAVAYQLAEAVLVLVRGRDRYQPDTDYWA